MTRQFTGRHMLIILLAFFGIVVVVNLWMATEAEATFGGEVVENSYVASQHFNRWLAEAREQQALGWQIKADAQDRHAVLDLGLVQGGDHGALAGATITAVAEHPVGLLNDVNLRFAETTPGHYVAVTQLPAGRWRLHVNVSHDGRRAEFVEDVTA